MDLISPTVLYLHNLAVGYLYLDNMFKTVALDLQTESKGLAFFGEKLIVRHILLLSFRLRSANVNVKNL